MIPGGGYHSYFEQVVGFASQGELETEIRAARAEYFAETGEVREDEPGFEARIEAFTEWYVLDRPVASANRTPLELFLASQRAALGTDDVAIFEGFRQSFRGLFEFLKVNKEHLIVRDLATGAKLGIFERRTPVGMTKGSILDARIINFGGEQVFTRSILYHPLAVRKLILAETKALKGQDRAAQDALLRKLSIARLRCDRYHRVDVERLYRQLLSEEPPPA